MSDWKAPDVQKWKEEARALQQNMFLRLGDREWDEWDEGEKSNIIILRRKVGYGLYTEPQNLPDGDNLGYTKEQFENIKLISDSILKKAKRRRTIQFYCIFVYRKIRDKRFNIPVFRVKGEEDRTLFVDSDCRVYESWNDYLNSNNLPKCMYCYPRDGFYKGDNGQVLVDFGTSPACNVTNRIMDVFNGKTTVGNLFQSFMNFVDRKFSGQSIGLGDLEKRKAWLGDVGRLLSMAQDQMRASITQTAAAGNVATKEMCITYNVVTVGCLTVNGLTTLNDFITLVLQADLTPLALVQFSASVLFYTNSLINVNTAKGIIQDTQKQVLNQYCDDLSPTQIEELFALSGQVQGKSQLHKNSNKIKAVNHIEDKKAFFESLVTARSYLEGNDVQFSFEDPGLVKIDKELHIAPNKIVQISKEDLREILDYSQKLKNSVITDAVYVKRVQNVLKRNRLKMQYQRHEAIARLKKAFQTDNLETVKVGGKYIFENMTLSELDRLSNVMTGSGKNYNSQIIKIANEFAKMLDCKTPRDYSNYVEFTSKYLDDLKKQKEADYQVALKGAKINPHDTKRINEFAKEYGIKGKQSVHFTKEVFKDFETNQKESFKALNERYTKLQNTVLPVNANAVPRFRSDSAAIYHYFKHSDFGGEMLTPEQYFKIASNLVGEDANKESDMLNQQGNMTIIVFTNPINGAKGVVFQKLSDGTQSLATLFFDDEVLIKKKETQNGN